MTKQEIINSEMGSDVRPSYLISVTQKDWLRCMDLYAEQESIAFAEWVEKRHYREEDELWYCYTLLGENLLGGKTTSQLYKEFKKQNP